MTAGSRKGWEGHHRVLLVNLREGDELVRFIHRTFLGINHPHKEVPRFPGRRLTNGIFSQPWKINPLPDEGSGD